MTASRITIGPSTDAGFAPEPDHPAGRMPAAATTHTRNWWIILAAVWLLSAAYVLQHLPHGWVPHDEGTLAQSAQRVLAGELPHRDFAAVYTGGLSYLNALGFRWLGTNLLSLRLLLFVVFLLWVPALYYIATRLASPLAAGSVTVLAVAWSLPNYSAAMPSWYNLFLATFGTAALFRHLDVQRGRWLVIAGLCAGLSCLVKSVGLYFIAAVLLYILYLEQSATRARRSAPQAAGTRWYSAVVTAALACFVAMLVLLVHHQLGAPELVHFVLPGSAITALLLWREWTGPAGAGVWRSRTLLRLLAPFLIGACIPIALFLVPYIHSGSLASLVRGVFIAPMKRLHFAAMRPPQDLLIALPVAIGTGLVPYRRPTVSRILLAGLLVALGAVVVSADTRLYQRIWSSMRVLVPVTVLTGACLLAFGQHRLAEIRQHRLVLLLAVVAMCGLVQFPFSAPVYFFYVAPLVVLAALAAVTAQARPHRFAPTAALVLYLLFAVVQIHPGFIYRMGIDYHHDTQTERLALDRGGILVTPADAEMYGRLVATLRHHASGDYTFATPDCPEVYFLAGLRNPTPTIFDFFDDRDGRAARVLHTLDIHHVTAIVLNDTPSFSGPVPQPLRTALAVRYPRHERIGHFEVRWRE